MLARQSKSVNFSEIFRSIDVQLSEILRKCDNVTSIHLLKPLELNQLNSCLFLVIKNHNLEQTSDDDNQKLKNCLELLYCILNSSATTEIKLSFVNILKHINECEFFTNEPVLINIVSKINEYWLVKIKTIDEIPRLEYLTLRHLLTLCTSEKTLVSDIQRLSAIRKSVTAVPFDKTVPSLRPLLIKLVQKLQILSSEHGQRFIAQVLVLSQKIMMEIHKTVLLDLSSCNKKKAAFYGKIYVLAWHVASEDMRKLLEKACFQNLMESMMKEQRTSLELNKSSQNILSVLEVWHSERSKKNPDFITMITNAYQPILWKYLQSGFNVHRCNATDIFFKAFPLQRIGDSAVEAETLFNKQFDAMLASLTDDCHIVRIIGIREVCNILSLYWNSFDPIQIQKLMSVISKQNAYDASSAEVRRMVYLGFQSLVKSLLSREYVKQILPNLADNIHDVNQKVRKEFFQLLICIKELKDPNFKYSDCVSMGNIQYRLAEDNIVVGQLIVKLLMRNYYHSKMTVIEWTRRFIYLIKTYRNSYRNFFSYSSKSLPFTDACTIIYEILSQMGTFVLSKFEMEVDKNEKRTEYFQENKNGKKKTPLLERNKNLDTPEAESKYEKCAFDELDVVLGLFDIVTILWVLHDAKLNKPENEEIRFKLYDTYIKYAQPFINYYKDSSIFLGVITLSGNIPASLLRQNSITLPGYCIKTLKSIKVGKSDKENEAIISMLIALTKWGRGSEILEQVALWLDAAFETKDLNETILPRRRVKISETIQPDSIVAINILDTLLKKEYLKLSILKKNYCELFSLWKFMSRIKKLIETRIEEGEPFEQDLVSDEFLNRCFQRYVKIIPLLKEDEKNDDKDNSDLDSNKTCISRQKEMENVIEWGENFLFPLLQGENLEKADASLITTVLEDILYVADNMIIVHMVNTSFHFRVAHFVLKLLGTKYGYHFVKAASRVTVALNFSAKLLFKVKDDLQIFSTVIPSLLSRTLDVLASQNFSLDQIKNLDESLPVIKTCFGKILTTYHDNLSSTFSLKENVRQLKLVVSFFVDSIVNIISREIPGSDCTIPAYSTLSQLPPISNFLFSLFYNKKIWTSLFVHIISSKLSGKSVGAKETVTCIILLNLCAASNKNVSEADLKKALASATRNLLKLRESVGGNEKISDTLTYSETETATKKTWPSNAATKENSSTWTKLDSENDEDTSKEKFVHSEQTDENQKNNELSKVSLNFHSEGNNLEMDFINCGFELIKHIESTNEKRSLEAEDLS